MAASVLDLPLAASKLTQLKHTEVQVLLYLYEKGDPWLITEGDHVTRTRFYELGLVEAAFPEVRQGDSGRQFWLFNDLGTAVAELAKVTQQLAADREARG